MAAIWLSWLRWMHDEIFIIILKSTVTSGKRFDKLGTTGPPTFEIVTKAEPNPPTCDNTNM